MACSSPQRGGQEDVRMYDYFKFPNTMFCSEVHTIIHNDFLNGFENMEDKLKKAYPERSEEISDGFASLLKFMSVRLITDMSKFSTYFGKNFRIPQYIPLYDEKENFFDEKQKENEKEKSCTALERIVHLNTKIITTRTLNTKLREKIAEIKDQIKRQETIKMKVKSQEINLMELKQTRNVLSEMQKTEPSKNIKIIPSE